MTVYKEFMSKQSKSSHPAFSHFYGQAIDNRDTVVRPDFALILSLLAIDSFLATIAGSPEETILI